MPNQEASDIIVEASVWEDISEALAQSLDKAIEEDVKTNKFIPDDSISST